MWKPLAWVTSVWRVSCWDSMRGGGGGEACFGEKLALLPVPQVNVNKSPNFLFWPANWEWACRLEAFGEAYRWLNDGMSGLPNAVAWELGIADLQKVIASCFGLYGMEWGVNRRICEDSWNSPNLRGPGLLKKGPLGEQHAKQSRNSARGLLRANLGTSHGLQATCGEPSSVSVKKQCSAPASPRWEFYKHLELLIVSSSPGS